MLSYVGAFDYTIGYRCVMADIEEWRAIDGFPRYEVSNLGRVRSWAKRRPPFVADEPRILTLAWTGKYLQANLYVGAPARGLTRGVHVLVAHAFIGPRPEGMHVCHNDSDARNNAVENLRYDTPLGNAADQILVGTHPSVAAAHKTACKHGHAYTPENTGIQRNTNNGRPARYCKTCRRARNAAA